MAGENSKREWREKILSVFIELVPYIFLMAGENSKRVSGDGGFR
jgi:hypothetical protein